MWALHFFGHFMLLRMHNFTPFGISRNIAEANERVTENGKRESRTKNEMNERDQRPAAALAARILYNKRKFHCVCWHFNPISVAVFFPLSPRAFAAFCFCSHSLLPTLYRCIAMILSDNVLQLIWIVLFFGVCSFISIAPAHFFSICFSRAFSSGLAFFRWSILVSVWVCMLAFFFAQQQIIFVVI